MKKFIAAASDLGCHDEICQTFEQVIQHQVSVSYGSSGNFCTNKQEHL
jgi:hypothetical protein